METIVIKQIRDDVNYLLSTPPEEFDLGEVKDAIILLSDSIDDLGYQLSLPEESFKGPDYNSWYTKAAYKLNLIKSARRRFSAYNKKVAEETGFNLLKSLCRAYFSGNTSVEPTIRHMVMEDGE